MTDYTLPDGFDELRPHQEVAITQALEAYADGNDVVFMDAPTGSGKTLIGVVVAQELGGNALYVCSDKSLQDQFARDFPHAKVLKGRSNYPTQSNPSATAADCTAMKRTDKCFHCVDGKEGCPYEIAKAEALTAPLACINTSYLLTEANYVKGFSGRDLIIADEGDTLEQIMMGFVEYRASARLMADVKMQGPKKGVRKARIVEWLVDYADALDELRKTISFQTDPKRYNAVRYEMSAALRVAEEMRKDMKLAAAGGQDAEEKGIWLRDYEYSRQPDADPGLILKPVVVNRHGMMNLWRHAEKWLIMSATIVSSDEMADSLGLPLDYATVQVPMTFPVENRQVIVAPIANVVYKEMDTAVKDLAYAIGVAADKHAGDRMIVHTVSYSLARQIRDELYRKQRVPGRRVITYTEGRGREDALRDYRRTPGAILLAPSMTRGIDLKDDDCRVQVIAKVPFPALGDKQISQRMHMPGGQMWYTVKSIRDIIQMTGRGVRHEEDWCVTYIFDQQFSRNLWGKWRRLFPAWWAESVVTNVDVREFMRRGDD